MKRFLKNALSVLLFVMITVCFCACGKEAADPFLSGEWGYIHEPETTVLSFKGDKVTFDGPKYSFTADGTYLHLTSGDTSVELRYMISGKHFYVYRTTEYTYTGEGTPEGLAGKWENPNKWSFEFSDDGQFVEDGYFPGSYTSDGKAFKLMYTDHFEDTVCFYTIDGNTLTVEYPWEMAQAE